MNIASGCARDTDKGAEREGDRDDDQLDILSPRTGSISSEVGNVDSLTNGVSNISIDVRIDTDQS